MGGFDDSGKAHGVFRLKGNGEGGFDAKFHGDYVFERFPEIFIWFTDAEVIFGFCIENLRSKGTPANPESVNQVARIGVRHLDNRILQALDLDFRQMGDCLATIVFFQ